jgi:hypothetical protein
VDRWKQMRSVNFQCLSNPFQHVFRNGTTHKRDLRTLNRWPRHKPMPQIKTQSNDANG